MRSLAFDKRVVDEDQGENVRGLPPVLRLSSSVKTALPEGEKALAEAWQRRRLELGTWEPSGGWLNEVATIRRTVPRTFALGSVRVATTG